MINNKWGFLGKEYRKVKADWDEQNHIVDDFLPMC